MSGKKVDTTFAEFARCAELLRMAAAELDSLVKLMEEDAADSFPCESKMLSNYSGRMAKWAIGVRASYLQDKIDPKP